LKTRLAIGAGLMALATVLTSAMLLVGMARVADRLDAALAAERRLDHYAALSTQISTFIVVAAEMIQREQPPAVRASRIEGVAETISGSFTALRAGLDRDMAATRGLDAQSRRGTQSLLIARMEAQFQSAVAGLTTEASNPASLRAWLDTFASGVEPLLAESVNEEKRLRTEILTGIADLRRRLTLGALAMAALALALSAGFFFGLIRPQFRRLDALRAAARQIGAGHFDVSLETNKRDEIGQLSSETRRMATALASRAEEVAQDRAALNETIRARTADLSAANTRLERIDEDRRRFFADISHELRTPLTVILMEAQIGRQGGPDPKAAFSTIETRALRLSRRIDDLLRIARSETGQLALDLEPLDLSTLAREAVSETRAEAASAGMTLSCEAPEGLQIRGDRNWLRQVIASLIRNAIRHARAGKTVSITAETGPTGTALHITDQGPGIPPEAQSTVFDRFSQGSANPQGFGLGLALVRWVVEEQGGTISVESPVTTDPAQGTKITIRFPHRSD
jgi:signal transduction histidine kinase